MKLNLFFSLFVIFGTLSAFVVCSPVYGQHPDAVGIWFFDEGAGDTAEDSSGNGHTAKVAAGKLEWGTGKFGKAVGFKPGTHLEVEHTDALNLETFTVAAWVKFITDTGGGEQNIAYKQVEDDRATRNYTLKMWEGTIFGIFANGGNGDAAKLRSTTNVIDKKWHYTAITYDKTALRLYIDGTEEASVDFTKAPETNDAPITIGSGLDAFIDELQILSVALSADDIQSDMNNGIQLAVEATGKATTTWAYLKTRY